MHIVAVVAVVRTNPVETVKLLLNCIYKVFASDDCIWNLSNLPARIRVDVNIGLLLLSYTHIVGVLASLSFLADTSFEVGAKCCFVIDFTRLGCLNLSDLLEKTLKKGLLLFFLLLGLFLFSLLFLDCSCPALKYVREILSALLHRSKAECDEI